MKNVKLRMSMFPVTMIGIVLALGAVQIGFGSHSKALLEEDAKRTTEETIEDLVYIDEGQVALASGIEGNGDTIAAAQAAFIAVNKERTKNGLHAFKWSETLNEAAATRAKECSKKWSHVRPDGSDYFSVDPEHVYGESISKGYRKASKAVSAWMKSDIHKDNLLDPSFNSVAINVYVAKDGNWYWVVEFGM